jgi:hypothetical protein
VVTTTSPVVKPSTTKGSYGAKASSKPGPAEPAVFAAPKLEAPPTLALPDGIVADEAFVAVTVATARELEASRGETITAR